MTDVIIVSVCIGIFASLWIAYRADMTIKELKGNVVDSVEMNRQLREDKDRMGQQLHDCMLGVQAKEDEIIQQSATIASLTQEVRKLTADNVFLADCLGKKGGNDD